MHRRRQPSKTSITGTSNNDLQRSLFDFVPSDFNEYEKQVALFLDSHPQVLWWYRNLVGAQNFSIQGYRRGKIYPDFLIQQGKDARPTPLVIVLESKGKQLEGNADTAYKKQVAGYFQELGKKVTWQELGQGFHDQTFRFQVLDQGEYEDWSPRLKAILEERLPYG